MTKRTATRLWHFTCHHGQRGIGVRGEIIPQGDHPLLWCDVSWFTTLGTPDRETTGLGHHFTSCDRMAFRYAVIDWQKCRPWIGSPERDAADPAIVRVLEAYGDPDHWFIASEPVRARLA